MARGVHDVKNDLRNYLDVIGGGRFATSGLLPNASNPGLFVHGVGKVGLPLSERDAEALAIPAHRAPFGKGSQTFVDPEVRKTWELNPDQFEIHNPAWDTTLQQAVERVAEYLGVLSGASSVRPELHKHLLYEPGAFFEKHWDIAINQLKGKDQLRMHYLSEACRDHGFCLYFAHLEFSIYGSVDEDEDNPVWWAGADVHEFLEELEATRKLKTIFESDGQRLAKGIELEDEDEEETIINRPNFEDLEPDEEECDGFTGNEGCTATHFYYRTCAVYVKSLLDEIQGQGREGKSEEELKKLCEMVIDAKKFPEKPREKSKVDSTIVTPWQVEEPPKFKPLSRVSDDGLGAVVQAAMRLDLPEIAEVAVGFVKSSLPTALFGEIGSHLAKEGPTAAWPR
ncbi:MAG: hypothetical protein Q9226_000146 [Calogaya cf. arnoldii]